MKAGIIKIKENGQTVEAVAVAIDPSELAEAWQAYPPSTDDLTERREMYRKQLDRAWRAFQKRNYSNLDLKGGNFDER